jgi:GNAT superfamily N-acetyltransferase
MMTGPSLVECSTLVRPAVGDDIDAIVEMHIRGRRADSGGFPHVEEVTEHSRSEHSRSLRERIGSPGFRVLCAELGNKVVGFVMIGPCVYPDPHPATISELRLLLVDPDHPHCGIDTLLHDGAVRAWQQAAVESARLWMWECNKPAKAFYARLGWQSDGARRPDDPRIGEYRMIGYRLTVPLIG